MATTWAGSGTSTNQADSMFYGAYAEKQCVSIPAGYTLSSMEDYNNGYSKLLGSMRLSRNLYTACLERYKVSKTNSSASCTSCLAGKNFYSGGEEYNTINMPISSYFSQSLTYYGPYKQIYNANPIATTSTSSPYEYLFEIDWSDSQGAQCLDTCPVGFKSYVDPTSAKGLTICKKCVKDDGEYGSSHGGCSICPETTYPREDAALECTDCPWPFLSHIPRGTLDDNDYNSCIGSIDSIAFPVFCLCLNQNDITVVCLLITAFFSINLFIFFYFGDFSAAIDKSLEQIQSDDISKDTVEIPSRKKKKERKLSKRGVLIGLVCYIAVPFIDNITDLAFLLSNKFVSFIFFMLFGFFFCLPGLYFFKTLIELKAVPKFYILPMPKFLLYDEYNTLYKLIVGLIVLFPFVVINTPVLFPVSFSYNLLGLRFFPIYPLSDTILLIYLLTNAIDASKW